MAKIGDVIRKERKKLGLTQEEVALRLGVTAPAVNKWEKGSTLPDITLLAPIARLLQVSLEELLSFQEELSQEEIRSLLQQGEEKAEQLPFEDFFQWVKNQLHQYPNCETLLHGLTALTESQLIKKDIHQPQFDAFLESSYQRLLHSKDTALPLMAAESLYHFYFRKEDYRKAADCLDYFSKENPERKRKQALLYAETGETEKAKQTYEEILLADYQILQNVCTDLYYMELKAKNLEKAAYYIEKLQAFTRVFEMGQYREHAAALELAIAAKDQEMTIRCVQGMMQNIEDLFSFTHAPLYAHMTFKQADPAHIKIMEQDIQKSLLESPDFSYMEKNPQWQQLIAEIQENMSSK